MSAIFCCVTAVFEVNNSMSMDASYDPGAFTECGPILDFIYEDAKRFRENRNRGGRGGYMIHLNDAHLLDCYDACQDGRCLASKANSATNYYNTVLRRKAVANSSIVVGTKWQLSCENYITNQYCIAS